MTKVVLDAEAFKALSSDTRLQILKALDVRRLTVSEMGRLLGLNKATVFEHLKQLALAELVKKEEDEGRKWVYYRLSWKGRNVVHPENAQFLLMLATSVLSAGGIVAAFGQLMQWWGSSGEGPASSEFLNSTPPPTGTSDPAQQHGADPQAGAASPTPTHDPSFARDESGNGPVLRLDPDAGPSADGDWLQEPALWIMGLLVLLVVLTSLLAWRLTRDRRDERAGLRRRIGNLPPDVNDDERRGSTAP